MPEDYDDEEKCKWLYWTGFVLVSLFTGSLLTINSPIGAASLYIDAAFGVALKRWRIERNARKERKDGPC